MTLSDATLEAARRRGDAAADAVVLALGGEVLAVNALLRSVRRNDDPLPAALPPAVSKFLAGVAPPPWWQRTRVLAAQRWATEHLLHVTVALFCASLPSAYAAADGARVLASTGRMTRDLDRRINETARFVLAVVEPAAFDPVGHALTAVRKVRLVHASVRRMLTTREPGSRDVPINLEDQLGTLLGFSVVVVRALRRMGVDVSAREADDFVHLWAGVGAMLGLDPELLPDDFAGASRCADAIAQRHFRASPHGRELMAALLVRMEAHVDLPGLRAAPRALVRKLLGDRTADLLGVPAPGHTMLAAVGGFADLSRRVARGVTPLVGRRLLDAVVSVKLGGEETSFPMPSEPTAVGGAPEGALPS